MTLPVPLRPEATDRLPRPVGGSLGSAPPLADGPQAAAGREAGGRALRPRAVAAGRAATGRLRGGLSRDRLERRVKDRILPLLRRAVDIGGAAEVRERAGALAFQVAQLRDEVAAVRPLAVDLQFARREADANRVNQELLKGEVRSMVATVEELGMAFAPGTGLAGAGARFAELREAVHVLERRLRTLPTGQAAAVPDDGSPATARAPQRAPESALFDYVGFERRFRGDPVDVLATLADRYADLLAGHQPVVDIGCGRAELLQVLAGRGVEVLGVEPDPGMAAEARAAGVPVYEGMAGDFLRGTDDHTLGAVISTHVVEHLPLDALIEMLELSVRKLVPGGIFVAETPNPASLIVLGNSYILDPTHVQPLHPSLLAFLCEGAGFRDVRLRFHAPATDYHLAPVDDPAAPAWVATLNANFSRLNEVLFGPQEYAVIAATPPEASPPGTGG